jgi:hypothetical protein
VAEAATVSRQHGKDRVVDRLGLRASLRRVGGRPAVQEQFPGDGTVDTAEDDRAAV